MISEELILRDVLALERTRLSNERTFLSYFRTFVVFLSSGLAIVKLDSLEEITELGIGLLVLAPVLLLIGFVRFLYVKRKIKKYYKPKNKP